MLGRDRVLAGVNVRGPIGVVTNLARPFRTGFVEFGGRGSLSDVQWGLVRSLDRAEAESPRRTLIPRPFRNR